MEKLRHTSIKLPIQVLHLLSAKDKTGIPSITNCNIVKEWLQDLVSHGKSLGCAWLLIFTGTFSSKTLSMAIVNKLNKDEDRQQVLKIYTRLIILLNLEKEFVQYKNDI